MCNSSSPSLKSVRPRPYQNPGNGHLDKRNGCREATLALRGDGKTHSNNLFCWYSLSQRLGGQSRAILLRNSQTVLVCNCTRMKSSPELCSFILVVVWVGPDVEEISDAHAFPGAVPPEEPRSSKALVTRVCCLACAFAIIPTLGFVP